MKLLLNLIILIIIKLSYSQDTNSECTSYINSKSTYTQLPCGSSLEEACSTITLAAQSCNIQQFNSTIYNISPGYYSFNGIDAFGTIKNKNITIINSNYSINSTTLYTSVIFDLEGSTNTLFNIDYDSINYSKSIINVTGITFINGNQINKSSIATNNNGSPSKLYFQQCIFDNIQNIGSNVETIGGAFSWNKNSKSDLIIGGSTVSFTQCTYQNTNTTGMIGSFFYASSNVIVSVTFSQCLFTNLSGNGQGSIIYSDSTIVGDQAYVIQNSTITNNQIGVGGSVVYLSTSFIIINSVFSNNSGGGIGFYFFNRNVYMIQNCSFDNNINVASVYGKFITVGLQFFECSFTNNNYTIASNTSGAVTLLTSGASFQNSIFNNNYGNNGAAIFATGTTAGQQIQLLNTTFNNNHALFNGSIYLSNTFLQVGSDTIFNNNSAVLGSSIYCSGSEMNFISRSITFSNNNDTTTNQESISKDTNGVTCGPNGTNTCSIKGDLNSLKICGVTGNNDSSDDKHNHGLSTAKKVLISLIIIGGVILFVIVLIFIIRKAKEKSRYKPIGGHY